MIEIMMYNVNKAFELKEQLEKSYADVICVFEKSGRITVAADTNSLKNRK